MRYKLLIFDLDNTVLDYDRSEEFALDKTLTSLGFEPDEDLKESYRSINEQMWQRLEKGEITSEQLRIMRFTRFAEIHGIDWNPSKVSTIYLDNLGLGGFLVTGAESLLFELKKDFRLASITNGISDVQRNRLSNSPLEGIFEPLLISDEVGISKPDPGIFRLMMEQTGIKNPSDILMIGDSLSSDIAGASAVGIDSCWYNPSGLELQDGINPTYIISVLEEVKKIVYMEK